MAFDPFKKQWRSAANMRTARTDFACVVVSDKVYVAGGSSLNHTEGLASAEAYDPHADTGEDLPSMPCPLIEWSGLSHGGLFVVVGRRADFARDNTYVFFDPSERKWHVMKNVEPFCKLRHHYTISLDSNIYSILADGTVTVRATGQKGWRTLGVCPVMVPSNYSRPWKPFGFQLVALRRYLFVVGGMSTKFDTNNDVWDIVKLNGTKFCDPTTLPLEWQDVKPMPE